MSEIGLVFLVGIVVPIVAFGQVTLPYTFLNGTIADADDVNANFEAVLEETARYHTTVPVDRSSVAIPTSVTLQLCKDEDGCEIILLSIEPGGSRFAVAPPVRMFIDDTGPYDRWITTAGRNGDDGDNAETPVLFDPGTYCVFSDGALGVADGSEGFFLFGTLSNSPEVECRLTIAD